MEIAVLHHEGEEVAGAVVEAAMVRSFTAGQVRRRTYDTMGELPAGAVLVAPGDGERALVERLSRGGRKVLVLGEPGREVAPLLGLRTGALPGEAKAWHHVRLDGSEPFNASPVSVRYDRSHGLGAAAVLEERPLARYDFTDEWNNLGYGRMGPWPEEEGGGLWAVACLADADGARPLAALTGGGRRLSLYAAVLDLPHASLLWFNRAAGPVDSVEWRLVETFFCDYRAGELPTFPLLCEVPYGLDGLVTMRLDCDQAVSSARCLFELYSDEGVPFSMAVTPGIGLDGEDMRLLRDVARSGGSLLTHSMSHRPDWGGCYEAAVDEVRRSVSWLEGHIEGAAPVRYAVSPFHRNPPFAVRAMADAGIAAFVGGIIHNDPQYLLGRAGRVPALPECAGPMVSLSQQCMLHGDCFHRYGDSVEPYIESFFNHLAAGSIFGYLDHPFSEAYSYGWRDEEERAGAHRALMDAVKGAGNIGFSSLGECLDFLVMRDRVVLRSDGGRLVAEGATEQAGLELAVRRDGEVRRAVEVRRP
ncbi:MAG TPA: hypothetical protein ENJ37_05015 [Deltaproteobacteria bacterium]|nr:hypothetical protein [Deltaproteobacteria bacterium]